MFQASLIPKNDPALGSWLIFLKKFQVGRLPSTAQGDGRTFAFPIKLIGQEKFNLCSPQQGQFNNNTKVNCVKTLNYFTT